MLTPLMFFLGDMAAFGVGKSVAGDLAILALAVTIGLAIGAIQFRGLRLGISGVLFSALLFGQMGFRVEANVLEYYEFRLLPDFEQSGTGATRIQDAFMNVHYWDQFQVQVGRFKEPVSYEQLVQDRFVPTLERSLIDRINPDAAPQNLNMAMHDSTPGAMMMQAKHSAGLPIEGELPSLSGATAVISASTLILPLAINLIACGYSP